MKKHMSFGNVNLISEVIDQHRAALTLVCDNPSSFKTSYLAELRRRIAKLGKAEDELCNLYNSQAKRNN